jgi:hypothetical protein
MYYLRYSLVLTLYRLKDTILHDFTDSVHLIIRAGTDGVGASLLRAFNTHSLGAFHVGLEIGFPVRADGTGWELSYGWTEEDTTGGACHRIIAKVPRRIS